MSEIAKEAGLSRYTVSKILNGDTSVKEASRKVVMAICERHGYMPDNNAVGLVKGKTNIIAMIVPYITDDFYNEMIELTERLIEGKGYRLIYKSSYNDAAKEAEIIQSFLALKVCALIIVPVVEHPDMRIHTLAAKHVPVIYLDRTIRAGGYSVLNDNEASAAAMTGHLIKRSKDITYLGSFYGDANPTAAGRRNGYMKTMKKNGLNPVFIPCDASTERQDNERFGYENMKSYLKKRGDTKAVFCVTDAVALGVLKAIREAGLVPGKDIFVAGHDNLRFSEFVSPSITTMKQPKEHLCKACVDIADSLIKGRIPRKKQHILISELVIRESA
ncbi:MAG: LacI family DNA-binding transcriptional regulator [Spirochaetes bacterium]|nr:LacI family DNA-binding transcriptional regulator [Spirochaetota bacterium]